MEGLSGLFKFFFLKECCDMIYGSSSQIFMSWLLLLLLSVVAKAWLAGWVAELACLVWLDWSKEL